MSEPHSWLSIAGRTGRNTWWANFLLALLFNLVTSTASSAIAAVPGAPEAGILVMGILVVVRVLTVAYLTVVTARRFHDQDLSAWYLLFGLVPFLGWVAIVILAGFVRGTDGPNKYGTGSAASQSRPAPIDDDFLVQSPAAATKTAAWDLPLSPSPSPSAPPPGIRVQALPAAADRLPSPESLPFRPSLEYILLRVVLVLGLGLGVLILLTE